MGKFRDTTRTKWRCRICGEIFSGGKHLVQFDLEKHNEKHQKEYDEGLKDERAFEKELKEFENVLIKKYPKWNAGHYHLFEELTIKPTPLWKCPKCKKEMPRHYKKWHDANFHDESIAKMHRGIAKRRELI